MIKLLLTGFEPFGGADVNPSKLLVDALQGTLLDGANIVGHILPVDRVTGPTQMISALDAHNPDAVLCLGLAVGRPVLSIERLAVNLLDFRIPDNAGNQAFDEPIVPQGPTAYFVTLPTRTIFNAVQAAGVPVELSNTAGTYLCNQVLYHLLHYLSENKRAIPAGFIHVPALPQQAATAGRNLPSMSLETMLAGVSAAVCAVAQVVSTQ